MNNTKDYIEFLHDTYPSWKFLPVNSKKAPLIKGGFYGASNDLNQLNDWVQKYPNMNLAIATFTSEVIVIDIDVKDGCSGEDSLFEEYGEEYSFPFDQYLWAETPRGGKHLFFECDDTITATAHANVLPLVDIRARKAYVCIEPSVIHYKDGSTGSYKFHNLGKPPAPISKWARDFLDLAIKKKEIKAKSKDIDFIDYLQGITEGNRDESMFRLALLLSKNKIDESVAIGVMKTFAANCIPPFPELDAIKKVVTVYQHKINNLYKGIK